MSLEEALALDRIPQKLAPTPAQLKRAERRIKFIDGLFQGKSVVTLAKELGCDRKTLQHDFTLWMQKGEHRTLTQQWITLFAEVKEKDPGKALDCLTRLIAKTLGEKTSVKVDVNVTAQQHVTVEETSQLLKRYDFLFKRGSAEGTVQKDGAGEQVAGAQAGDNVGREKSAS